MDQLRQPGAIPIPKHKDMGTLEFDPPDGFLGKLNIFPDPVTSPSYMELWDVEKNLKFHEWRVWIGSHWKLPVHICFLYVMAIFIGQIWMRRKQPFKLNRIMIVWNIILAAFSLVGFLRSMPEVLHLLDRPNGFYRIVCSREGYNNASAFWALIGTFSKVAELGDTAFIILRKKPLIFLHWFHHATVMMYTWGTFEYCDPVHRLFIVMNYFIHAVMYSYYALRAMGVSLHKSLSMGITSLQLGQMIAGVCLNGYTLMLITQGTQCARKIQNIQLALAMYGSYLVLFAHFFYTSYLAPNKKPKGKCHSQ